ncbi:MAG: thymidylate kinase [Phycisphaerae bacterium]|nr:thymidylate kinase [Phycisphaerae bacterium]
MVKQAAEKVERYTDYGALPGKLVIVEGIDGSGKSTQLDLLRKWIQSQGYLAHFSEWNSSPVVRETTRMGKEQRLLSPMSFSLIHAADFADRLERTILPPLRAGAVVLTDRYIYTAFARDVARGVDAEFVRRMYRFAPRPSAAIYFRVPLQEALHRILGGRPELKYYEAGMDLALSEDPYESFEIFQGRILQQYEQMVPEFGLHVIDATLPITQQQRQLREFVAPLLSGCLRKPIMPYGRLAEEHGVRGVYLAEVGKRDDPDE